MAVRSSVLFVSLPPALGGSIRALETHVGLIEGVHRILGAPMSSKASRYLDSTGLFDELVDVRAHGPLRTARALLSAWSLRRWALASGTRLTAIHANGMPEMAVAFPAARAMRVPLVVWAHGVDVPRQVRALAPMWRTPNVDVRWAAVSHAAADQILEAGVATPDRMTVVPNPIDPALVLADRPAPDNQVVTLAFLGGDSTRKGFDTLPGLMAALADLPVRLVTAGKEPAEQDPHWEALRQFDDRVVHLGRLHDVRVIYSQADVVLMPSRQESFGRVAAEAMMNAIPLVAFDIPALREVIGEGGLLVPVEDQEAFTAAVRKLAEDPATRCRLGEAGRERAGAYLPSAVSGALCRLYGLE